MKKTYCYSCCTHHETELMERYQTKFGLRWRCKKSINASIKPIEIRDQFGRNQTEMNKKIASNAAKFRAQMRTHKMGEGI
jgi:hypothetical protein